MTPSTPAKKWTYADYLALPDDGLQHQIIGGEHFVTAAPRVRHQAVLGNLHLLLAHHTRANGLGLVLFAPVDFVLSDFDVVQPDLIFITRERLDICAETHVPAAPDLAVEVLSPSTRRLDLELKRGLYERHGVREYWIVDPEPETVSILRFEGERFTAAEVFDRRSSSRIESPLLPGLSIDAANVFA